jgi:hypothetical protein
MWALLNLIIDKLIGWKGVLWRSSYSIRNNMCGSVSTVSLSLQVR